MAKLISYDIKHPIAVAVEPQRQEAMAKSEQYARQLVANLEKDLSENDWDRQKVAPYPKSNEGNVVFFQKKARYVLARKVTVSTAERCRAHLDPDPCVMSPEGIEIFVQESRENASLQYDAFIAKMIGKIGACKSVKLEGSHVWGYSHLYVVKKDGTEECWRTQQIVNVSKLGLLFNQFPSRKVKQA